MRFPIGGLLTPSSYLLRLPRYFGVRVQCWGKHAYSRVNSHIKHIAHALYHVIGLQRLKNNRIFGIPDPHLPVHYATFGALRWWLRVVYIEHPLYEAFLVQKQPQKWRFLGFRRGKFLTLQTRAPLGNQSPLKHVVWCKNGGYTPKNVISRAWEKIRN